MSLSNLSPDDPKLTAYALGELDAGERAALETALRNDPAARAAVEEIRAAAAKLEFALAAEPMVSTSTEPKLLPTPHRASLFRFPQVYYLVGGLAAACFAIFVAMRPEQARVTPRTYAELKLATPSSAKNDEPVIAANSMEAENADKAKATDVPATLLASEKVAGRSDLKRQAEQEFRQRREEQRRSAANEAEKKSFGSVGIATNGVVAAAAAPQVSSTMSVNQPLAKFGVKDERDAGFLRANSEPATKIGLEIRPAPLVFRAGNAGGNPVETGGGFSGIPAPRAMNTEAYAYQAENDFLGAKENPLSTFSIDVDTASYANLRRFILNGSLPPVDAVRIEEWLNYFPYKYAAPSGQAPFAASMEVASAPWAPTHRLVRIGLKGREIATAARPAANLVFLIDVSGSMNEPAKLPLVKESMRLLVGKLRADDRVAIVVYAGASGLALPSTPVRRAAEIISVLDELTPGGSTNGARGIELAYDIAKANFIQGGVNRVILCTDGDFNVGVTSEGALTRLIEEKAKSGVFLTALGFGMGNYKDATLEKLADKGNGNYGYIDTRREAEKLLVEQVNGTLMTIAKDVKIQVEFNPARVASYRLIGYENRLLKKEDFNNDAVDAGEIGAGHTVTALYEVVPAGLDEKTASGASAVDPLKYRISDVGNRKDNSSDELVKSDRQSAIRNPQSNELLTLKVRYKEPAGEVSQKLEFPLVDSGAPFAQATPDFKFAAAVAEFGMILRDSPNKGTSSVKDVVAMAEEGNESDAGGYRAEFVELVKKAEVLLR